MYQKQSKSTLNNKKLRNVSVTIPNNGYAYRHTFIRGANDMAIQVIRANHDTAFLAGRVLEDAVTQVRRALPYHPEFLTRATRNAEDFCTYIRQSIRDNYVDLKRSIRDAYVSIKKEKPQTDSNKMKEAKKQRGCFVVTSCNSPKVLKLVKKSFD